ncbi:SPW repeat protein [Microvirga sp. 2TAF3]|uniref:SPW repeat protein n=1 Tax=Microvirga sp. 2TAF3 TaxID=3233014 RepID=UPI003F973A60
MPFWESRNDKALNIIMIILGGILFVAPWVFGFRGEALAAWNAWLSGAIAALIAIMAVSQIYDWEEWLDLIVGLWITVSPWLLDFSGVRRAMLVHVVIGFGVIALAALELSRLYQNPNAP